MFIVAQCMFANIYHIDKVYRNIGLRALLYYDMIYHIYINIHMYMCDFSAAAWEKASGSSAPVH